MSRQTVCVVCGEEPAAVAMCLLCARCGRAFDRWNRTSDSTHAALIEWAAARTRRFERKRSRAAFAALRGRR